MPQKNNNDKSALIKQVKQALALADSHLKKLKKEYDSQLALEQDSRKKADLLITAAQTGKLDQKQALRLVNELMKRIEISVAQQGKLIVNIRHLQNKIDQLQHNFTLLMNGGNSSGSYNKNNENNNQQHHAHPSEEDFWLIIKTGIDDLARLSKKK